MKLRSLNRNWKAVSALTMTAMAITCLFPEKAHATDCPGSALASPKNSNLYLYYPTVVDNLFPNFQPGYGVTPAQPFDVSDLDGTIGTTAQLRDEVTQVVVNDYCEFSVDVRPVTTLPAMPEPRWQVVAIGSDTSSWNPGLFGIASAVDTNDNDPQDHGRVFSQAFAASCASALSGTNSTLGRWAYAIGGTTSHEAGHNYGLAHGNSSALPGETPTNSHILATGSTGLTCGGRVVDRHFSDTSYSILGHNVGLNSMTLHNWDFVNPNGAPAHAMKIKILSSSSSLNMNWVYLWTMAPWDTPTISGPLGTQTYQGTSYNVFELHYSTPKSWSGGADGVVPPGSIFHLGATFDENVIVVDTQLFDSSNNLMTLAPRIPSYDVGDINVSNGNFEIALSNLEPERPMIIRDLRVQLLPRTAAVESMMRNQEPFFFAGDERVGIEPVRNVPILWEREQQKEFELTEEPMVIPVANLANGRNVDIIYENDPDCDKESRARMESEADANIGMPEVHYCKEGSALGLFPATRVYITATVIEPDVEQWDPERREYVSGPLETRIFFQTEGVIPDLNRNGTDDLLDIRYGESRDRNKNGIVDEVERRRERRNAR
ncbi:hypothetical protein L2725_12130 [Shewanella corallii]|uniref:Uncharacterized protein n=1 Tax=Shewanella corallii TaxID=560080 RepID=A0ABT0N7S7_9GAMM|nr:hypothetical protein [Shewanella corallii]MCL2914514.1 hypothetical protein [Shewanella corallii]